MPEPKGTLRLILWGAGARVASKVTPQEAASLNAVKGFVGYQVLPVVNTFLVYYFQPDGSCHERDEFCLDEKNNGVFKDYLPLAKEDSVALGFADKPWYRPEKLNASHRTW